MYRLNFPNYVFRLKRLHEKNYIFDIIRRKFVSLSPEEWVRQHAITFLVKDKKYPKELIAVEKQVKLHDTTKRYDIVVYNRTGNIDVLVECKSPNVALTSSAFDQIARYNLALNANFFWVTNGLHQYFYKIDYNTCKYLFTTDIPEYNALQ